MKRDSVLIDMVAGQLVRDRLENAFVKPIKAACKGNWGITPR